MTGTTHPELAAAQACLRLLHTARAALSGPVTAQTAALLAVPGVNQRILRALRAHIPAPAGDIPPVNGDAPDVKPEAPTANK